MKRKRESLKLGHAECQICRESFGLTRKGKVVMHGYTQYRSHTACSGSLHKPYPDVSAVPLEIGRLHVAIPELHQQYQSLNDTTEIIRPYWNSLQQRVVVNKYDTAHPHFKLWREVTRREVQKKINRMETRLKVLQRRLSQSSANLTQVDVNLLAH